MKKVIVKPECLARVNTLRIDDIFIPKEYLKLGKEYEVLEQITETKVIERVDFKKERTSVVKEEVSKYYKIRSEFDTEEFLASDFEEV